MSNTYQVIIVNPLGATLRTGPATGSGSIEAVRLGDAFVVEGLVYSIPQQQFNLDSIPAFIEAFKQNRVRGDVWARLAESKIYKNEPTRTYVAIKVAGTQYGILALAPEPTPIPGPDEISIRLDEIDETFRMLSQRRMELDAKRR